MPVSIIFQFTSYLGQFYWNRKAKYFEKSTDPTNFIVVPSTQRAISQDNACHDIAEILLKLGLNIN